MYEGIRFDKVDRLIIFGDLHSEYKTILKMLDILSIEEPNTPIYLLGDLVDRGPQAKEVVDLCMNLELLSVMGNHDLSFIDAVTNSTRDIVFLSSHLNDGMGGKATFKSYVGRDFDGKLSNWSYAYQNFVPKSHISYLQEQPFYRLIECAGKKYILTHAGISRSDWEIARRHSLVQEDNEKILTNILYDLDTDFGKDTLALNFTTDSIIWQHKYKQHMQIIPEIIQITGHVPYPEVVLTEDHFFLDSGCGKSGKLSALIIPDMKVISVPEIR